MKTLSDISLIGGKEEAQASTDYSIIGKDLKGKILSSRFDDYMSKPIDPEKFVNQIEAFFKTYLKLGKTKKRE